MNEILFAVSIALAPSFGSFAYLAKTKRSLWFAFLIGGVGWFGAAALRTPILGGLASSYGKEFVASPAYLVLSASMAGVFEEGVRYALMKEVGSLRSGVRSIVSFGLGWGFVEALLVYGLGLIYAVYWAGRSLTFMDALPGALERNLAVAWHLSFTAVIFRAVSDRKFVAVAMGLHALADFAVVSFMLSTGNVWYAEGLASIAALGLACYGYALMKGSLKPRSAG